VEGKKDYLRLLELAADEGQSLVEHVLQSMLASQQVLDVDAIKQVVTSQTTPAAPTEIQITPVNLLDYDTLLSAPFEALSTSVAGFGSEVSCHA
jgi:hypothetical protein